MSSITTIQSTDLITDSRADINNNFSALNTDKMETSVLDTDTTLAANSDSKVATQKAVKAYADALGGLATKTAGVSAGPASSSTQTITHGLGRVPKVIRISGYGKSEGNSLSSGGGSSSGIYTTVSGNACVYQPAGVQGTDVVPATSVAYAVYLGAGTGGGATVTNATGVIGNITSTQFDIVWTAASDVSLITSFMWEAD